MAKASKLWTLALRLSDMSGRRSFGAWEAWLEPIRVSDDGGLRIEAGYVDPVAIAAIEVIKKAVDKPAELLRSAKLFRACEAIQCAVAMPEHRSNALALVRVLSELRTMSGWTEEHTWLPTPPPRRKSRVSRA